MSQHTSEAEMPEPTPPQTKAQELRTFLLLSVLMAPVLAGMLVAGWGFLVWMVQMFAGPPGPPR